MRENTGSVHWRNGGKRRPAGCPVNNNIDHVTVAQQKPVRMSYLREDSVDPNTSKVFPWLEANGDLALVHSAQSLLMVVNGRWC